MATNHRKAMLATSFAACVVSLAIAFLNGSPNFEATLIFAGAAFSVGLLLFLPLAIGGRIGRIIFWAELAALLTALAYGLIRLNIWAFS